MADTNTRRGCNHAEVVSLRDLRRGQGLSLRELEKRTGISRATWSRVEAGKLLAEPAHLLALSNTLNVPADAWRIRFQLEVVLQKEVAA